MNRINHTEDEQDGMGWEGIRDSRVLCAVVVVFDVVRFVIVTRRKRKKESAHNGRLQDAIGWKIQV